MILQGVDVSEYQGQINWDNLHADLGFAIVRGGYGTTRIDLQAVRNRTLARNVHLPIAHYWYMPATNQDALVQASAIIDGLGTVLPGEPIALDYEEDYDNLTADAAMVARCLVARYGQPPLIYVNLDFLRRYVWSEVVSLGCGLWLAHWDNQAAFTDNVAPWPICALKQYDSQGAVDGIAEKFLLDCFNGDAAQFRAYGAIPPAA